MADVEQVEEHWKLQLVLLQFNYFKETVKVPRNLTKSCLDLFRLNLLQIFELEIENLLNFIKKFKSCNPKCQLLSTKTLKHFQLIYSNDFHRLEMKQLRCFRIRQTVTNRLSLFTFRNLKNNFSEIHNKIRTFQEQKKQFIMQRKLQSSQDFPQRSHFEVCLPLLPFLLRFLFYFHNVSQKHRSFFMDVR